MDLLTICGSLGTPLSREALNRALVAACSRLGMTATAKADGTFAFGDYCGHDGNAVTDLFGAHLQQLLATSLTGNARGNALESAELAACRTIERACAATRAELIAGSAFNTGGVANPFATLPPPARDRGIALYRFPATAPVALRVAPALVTIEFPHGPLGEATSAGFWLPIAWQGDFDVQMRYHLSRWRIGTAPACFALLAADRTTARAYYAQHTGEPHEGDRLGTVLGDWPLKHAGPATYVGEFRIRREGALVTTWHRVAGELWLMLGARGDDDGEPMIVSSKIWALRDCGGLHARITDLRIQGTPAAVQDPLPPRGDDPRCEIWQRLPDQRS